MFSNYSLYVLQEKYGPKGLGKASNGTPAKASSDSKQKPDVDINVGLSDRPPWFCRSVELSFYLSLLVFD